MYKRRNILGVDNNPKTIKGRKKGYITGIVYLAPMNRAGRGTVCPYASPGCAKACLNTAGRGRFDSIQRARINKTRYYFNEGPAFFYNLGRDLENLTAKAKRENLRPCARLNGTSDLEFYKSGIMEQFPKIQFYDYTKSIKRMRAYLAGALPKNYHLTFSRSEINQNQCLDVLALGGNIAVVFKDALPKHYLGARVLIGDKHDLTFIYGNKGRVLGLTAKGRGKKDRSGFIVDTF